MSEREAFEAWWKDKCPVGGVNAKLAARDAWKARAAVEAAGVPDGWRPIETAPENMTEMVVVYWIDREGEKHHDFDYTEDGCWMQWHNHAEHVEIIGGHGVSYTPPYTHWMPLPAAPGAAAPPVAQPAEPSGYCRKIDGCECASEAMEGCISFRRYPEQAQPAERKPLTTEQKEAVMQAAADAMDKDHNLSWRMALIAETERAHGIGD